MVTPNRVLRLPEVCEMTGLSRSTIYLLMGRKAFAEPIKLSSRAIGFRAGDVAAWIDGRSGEAPRPRHSSEAIEA